MRELLANLEEGAYIFGRQLRGRRRVDARVLPGKEPQVNAMATAHTWLPSGPNLPLHTIHTAAPPEQGDPTYERR